MIKFDFCLPDSEAELLFSLISDEIARTCDRITEAFGNNDHAGVNWYTKHRDLLEQMKPKMTNSRI